MQTLGNVCTLIAGLIYLLPLQHLLLELSRKREDGGGVIAALLLLVPMWLLLLVALVCVTATGGFDGLRLGRTWIHPLTVMATVAMAVVSFARFEILPEPNPASRWITSLLIQLLPALTLLVAVFSLNPGLLPGLPRNLVRIPWIGCATLSLALAGCYLGYRLLVFGSSRAQGLVHTVRSSREHGRLNLARIPQLDPQRDFSELLRLTNEFENHAVRAAALARLREHPGFITALAAELTTGSPEHALAAVDFASLTPEETKRLAHPARTAIERFTRQTQSDFRFIPKTRRTAMHRWGTRLFHATATKLQGNGVDFAPVLEAFDRTFTSPENRAP